MTLNDYLRKAQITRAQFAETLDVSYETVRRYLDGSRIPDRDNMVKIAAATGCKVTANDFFGIAANDNIIEPDPAA